MSTRSFLIRAGALAAVLSALLVTQAASARERHTSITGAQGKTATREVSRSQGDVSSSTTGPNGKTASREVDRSASGTSATLTGPNGKTVQRETTHTTPQ